MEVTPVMARWMRWVERQVATVKQAIASTRQVFVGAIVLQPEEAPIPAGWLPTDGEVFNAGDYPGLAAALGANSTPDMAGPTGFRYIIRAV